MADTKISALPASTTPLAGTEVLPIVQGSVTKQVSVANLTAGRAVSALSLTSTNDASVNGLTVGRGAGAVATNTVVGASALGANSSGSSLTAVGYQALISNNTGIYSTAVGESSLRSNTTGSNTAIGTNALYANNIGTGNVALGGFDGTVAAPLRFNTTGNYNTALGNGALGANTTASNSTAAGYQAGILATGIGNQLFGYSSGSAVTSGAKNVILGSYTGSAAPISATGSNFVVLSDGDGNVRQTIDSSGNVGLGTDTPAYRLDVTGSARITSKLLLDTGTAALPPLTFFGWTNTGIHNPTGTSLGFSTSGVERARIDSVGNMQMQTGAVMPYAPAPAAISAAATLTNANIQGQIISATGTTYTITMPLGTTLETLATWAAVNVAYDFYVINTASGVITMAVNTGVTSLGSLTIAIGDSAHFRIRRTAANTFVLYRLV